MIYGFHGSEILHATIRRKNYKGFHNKDNFLWYTSKNSPLPGVADTCTNQFCHVNWGTKGMVCVCEHRWSRTQTVKIDRINIEETNLQANSEMVIIDDRVHVSDQSPDSRKLQINYLYVYLYPEISDGV